MEMPTGNLIEGRHILSHQGWKEIARNMFIKMLWSEYLPMVRLIYDDDLAKWEFVHAEYTREYIENVQDVNVIWRRLYKKDLID